MWIFTSFPEERVKKKNRQIEGVFPLLRKAFINERIELVYEFDGSHKYKLFFWTTGYGFDVYDDIEKVASVGFDYISFNGLTVNSVLNWRSDSEWFVLGKRLFKRSRKGEYQFQNGTSAKIEILEAGFWSNLTKRGSDREKTTIRVEFIGEIDLLMAHCILALETAYFLASRE